MKNRIDSSRHKTPWDNQTNVTASQEFIRNKYNNNYVCKHPKLIDTKENELINSIEITNCRVCGSINIKKKGFTKNGIQRYYCNNCKKFFNPLTNTIFENHKISISEWIEFLFNIFNYGSITLTSKVNKNGVNTSSYWLHKIFLILKNCQDTTILDGKVYIDEMFYKVIKSDIKLKNGKQLRGLSSNQYCIGIGYDGKNIIAIVEGLGKTSSTKTKNTFLNHISENSTLIHDDEKSHHALLCDLARSHIKPPALQV